MEKTPIGIMPKRIWEEKRLQDLLEAMDRFEKADREIPVEWLKEYAELSKRLLFE